MKTGFNKHDIARDACQLFGAQAHQGYDWWWHSFTGYDAETVLSDGKGRCLGRGCRPAAPFLGLEAHQDGLGRALQRRGR